MSKILLICAGSMGILFSIVHMLFWKMLNWNRELMALGPENRTVMELLNIAVIYFLLASAGVTFFMARRDVYGSIEKVMMVFFAGFYVVRIFSGMVVVGFFPEEFMIWVLCLVPIFCYIVPLKKSGSIA